MTNTTNTAPAFMLTTNVAIVDETGYAWVPKRVASEGAYVRAYYSDGPVAECVLYRYDEAVQVIPMWEWELLYG